MGYWEFLLQKEGDQNWLPLDTSQVEILEGRYRVMAHTHQARTPVRIQISQLLRHQVPPKRRTLSRRGEINENGLMVVMPFTHLREGTWDILCASEESDNTVDGAAASPPWRYAVQLSVVAQDSVDDGDWFVDDSSAGLGGAIAAQSSTPESEVDYQAPAIDLQAAAIAMDEFQAQVTAGLALDNLPYGLTLPHTALLSSEGDSLELVATITGPQAAAAAPWPLTLVVRLSDPQTTAAVALAPVPLTMATLPATANLSITIPTQLSTRLLLGEVGLLAGDDVVALQRFTVTVDVASLFDAIANQAEAETDLDMVFPAEDGDETSAAIPFDLKTWDITSRGAPPREMPILTLPRSSPNCPPKSTTPRPTRSLSISPPCPPWGVLGPPPQRLHPAKPIAASPKNQSKGSVCRPYPLPKPTIPSQCSLGEHRRPQSVSPGAKSRSSFPTRPWGLKTSTCRTAFGIGSTTWPSACSKRRLKIAPVLLCLPPSQTLRHLMPTLSRSLSPSLAKS